MTTILPLESTADLSRPPSAPRIHIMKANSGHRHWPCHPAPLGRRLVPASTGMEYHRAVKIASEDVVEEAVAEPALEAIPGYEDETRLQYAGGLPGGYGGGVASGVV